MRRAARWLARAIALLVVLAVVAAGALAWRLSRGPISLDVLTPRIAAALAQATGSFQVHIGGTDVAWGGRHRGIEMRARHVRVVAPDGTVIARLPSVAIELAIPALLHGSLVPTSVDVLQPSLRLVRHPDGTIDLGVGSGGEATEGDAMLAEVLAHLTSREPGAQPVAGLSRVAVSDGTVVVQDLELGEEWRLPNLDVSLTREAGAIAARLDGVLELGPDRIHFSGRATTRAAGGADAEVRIEGVHPPAIAARIRAMPTGPLSQRLDDFAPALDRVDLALDGGASLTLDATWKPVHVAARLDAAGGTLEIGGRREDVRSLAIAADLDLAGDRVRVDELVLDLGGPALRASASLQGLSGPGSLTVDARLTALPIALAWRAWPEGVAASPRAWLTTNIAAGAVPEVHARLDASVSEGDLGTISGIALGGEVHYDGLSVRFLDTMPAVTGVRGGGTFSQSGFDLGVEAGRLLGIAVGPARVVISGLDAVPRIAIDASVRGPLADALRVLDAPPIEVAEAIGVDAATVSGTLGGKLRLAFPLDGRDLGLAGLGLRGDAKLQGVSLPKLVDDWSVTDGEVEVGVDAEAVTISGRAAVEGVPADVSWKEVLNARSPTQRTYRIASTVDSAGRKALGFDTGTYLTGPVAVTIDATQARGGPAVQRFDADLAGAAIDVGPLAWKKAAGAPGRLSARITIAGDRVTRIDSVALEAGGAAASGHAVRQATGDRWQEVDLTGSLAASKPGQPPGRLKVRLDAADPGPGYRFRVASNDSGALFDALDLYADAVGGQLDFAGTLDASRDRLDLDGHLEITDVTIARAPWLARAATLASWRGLADAFSPSGEGIAFDRVSGDLSRHGDVTSIKDGVAAARTLGLLISGSANQATGQVSLRGTLVPELYGLNRAIQKIPVVGWVFGGDREGGPVGVEFSVEGPSTDPKVAVHPLDSITPGVLGRLVGLLDRGGGKANKP